MVTGAAGMLGTDVCRALDEQHEVIAADIIGDCKWVSADGCRQLDITDSGQTLEVIADVKPELVVHCAAYTDVDGCERDPDRAYQVNAYGTWNVAAACEQVGAAILYISTDFVFDGEKGDDYDEFDTPNPISHYGRSKWAGEQLVREVCRRHYIVRTAWLYGENGKNFITTIIKAASEGKNLRVVADQIGSPTYTKDLADFVASQAGSPLYGTYHVTNKGSCSWHELAVKSIELAGIKDVHVTPIQSSDWPTPTRRPKQSVLRHLSLEMQGRDNLRTWEEALSEFVEKWITAKQ
ncbi:MAG: dTDP-4-dehydrorhamnose reductase [Armatimonadota bacterium]|nr:dTDP-4-dehydrorhamnose reductase [Armatimonadota bacterium]